MWAGYEEALVRYGLDVCTVWCEQGRADTCATTLTLDLARTTGITTPRTQDDLAAAGELPPWLGDPGFHRSHQAALVRKDPAFYRPHFPDDLPYVWPASDRERRIPLTTPPADGPPAAELRTRP
jgi:hypothetical protein